MTDLLSKLTNLSYELFGVFLPGIIASVFGVFFWIALGSAAPEWTYNILPIFNLTALNTLLNSMKLANGISAFIPLVIFWYFLGHIILWVGRSGNPSLDAKKKSIKRIWLSLIFCIPKPNENFNPKLQSLFDVIKKDFSTNEIDLDWRQFFPVAKIYLAQRSTTSLVSNYQNKYTLHRSITTICAVLFWLTLLALLGSFIAIKLGTQTANCELLFTLLLLSVIFVWGFSSSYMYHWEMFGNTIVTETYSLLHSPKDVESSQK